jgi:hypothetical protein
VNGSYTCASCDREISEGDMNGIYQGNQCGTLYCEYCYQKTQQILKEDKKGIGMFVDGQRVMTPEILRPHLSSSKESDVSIKCVNCKVGNL